MMDEFKDYFRELLNQHPNMASDYKLLKGILMDEFPQSQREINLLLAAFNAGIPELRNLSENDLSFRHRVVLTRLIEEYSISPAYAAWAVDTWLYGFGFSQFETSENVYDSPTKDSDFVLFEEGGGFEVVQYTGKHKDVVIPAEISGKKIKTIGGRAFQNNLIIESVRIESGITSICAGAFSGCTHLKYIQLPESLHAIGEVKGRGLNIEDGAFYATGLTAIDLPQSLTDIGAYSFAESQLQSVILPEPVAHIGKGAFEYCKQLETVRLPPKLNAIPNSMFKKCVSLNTVLFNDDLYEIESEAFSGCTNLGDIELPHRVVSIRKNVFRGCKTTSKIYIPYTVTRLGSANAYDSFIYSYDDTPFGTKRQNKLTIVCHPESFACKYCKAFEIPTIPWDK